MLRQRDKSGYLSEDTIAAIATEVGGAISIVRVSGPLAFSSLDRVTQSTLSSLSEPRKLIRSHLFLETGEPLDDALFTRFVQPQSYTGEDLVEYHLHGSPFIAQRLMETLASFQVRQALPGEFSFRGVRNGKMTLLQAEAVADLISSSNEGAVSLALEKMSGSQNQLLEELAATLRKMAVLSEVGIDFSDQDIEEVSLPHLKKKIEPIILLLKNLHGSYSRGFRLQDGIRIAFIGLPNVGKSSFFNAILGEDRSIVSDIAGTTRDVVRERLTLRGKKKTVTLRLEDTAGLRMTDHPIEKMGIDRTHKAIQEADLILFMVDPTSSFEATKEQWLLLTQSATQTLVPKTLGVLTKCDCVSSEQLTQFLQKTQIFGIQKWVSTSSLTGMGIQEAIETVIELCEQWTHRAPGEILLTRLDHLTAVSAALEHLQRAQLTSEIDLFAADIRQALHELSILIGDTPPDDILGKIFSDFCIGK